MLLHGFPETSLSWRKVAPELANAFTAIAADLPGYGESTLVEDAIDEGRISKRTMARALVDAMTEFEFPQLAVVGHDRGARVAYRLALDHPDRIRAVAVLDVIPILDVADRLTYDPHARWDTGCGLPDRQRFQKPSSGSTLTSTFARSSGSGAGPMSSSARRLTNTSDACATLLCFARCGAEYRADRIDLEHDRTDRLNAHRIRCPLFALWAQGGLMERFGNPLAIWRGWADCANGGALPGGHFMMEESPHAVADLVGRFLLGAFEATSNASTRCASEPER